MFVGLTHKVFFYFPLGFSKESKYRNDTAAMVNLSLQPVVFFVVCFFAVSLLFFA